MAAYWAFLEMSDAITRIGMESMLEENLAQALGPLSARLSYLRDHPARAHYYAEANGLSIAHALQAGRDYAWNLLAEEKNLRLFYQYLSKQISLAEFLDKAFEDMIDTLSHELVHILEESQEGSHNDVFFKRQKLMVSAMIGARERIAAVLAKIAEDPQYANNLGDISIKDFLDYVARNRQEPPSRVTEAVIDTNEGRPAGNKVDDKVRREIAKEVYPARTPGVPATLARDGKVSSATAMQDAKKDITSSASASTLETLRGKGYDILDIAKFEDLTGIRFLAQNPKAYSPFQDQDVAFQFAEDAAREIVSGIEKSDKTKFSALIIGCGSGLDALTAYHQIKDISKNTARIVAIDIDADAARNTKVNFCVLLNIDLNLSQNEIDKMLEDRGVTVLCMDAKQISDRLGKFDFVFFNAPDVYDTIAKFFAATLNKEAAVPKSEAEKASRLVVEGLKKFTIWKK